MVAAHCDDVAIGAGATLLGLAARHPGLRVHALVLTGAGSAREDEERAALVALLPAARISTTILGLPDGRLPEHWGVVKAALQELAQRTDPDLILAPQRGDAHQDHRLLAELVPTAYRRHLVLGYEVLKWESDLPRVNVYLPVTDEYAAHKADLLVQLYPSQSKHDWFDRSAFLGLMRIRGVQCHRRHAEAFVAEKLVLGTREKAGR